ncbi:hypothetical protein [Moorena producens]|uniref:hypothetical protein n=1 Tax=Moorena producens TaxID=1155739 RepID=UPI001314F1AD|nr:hypothetical protein [Moorena producens]
MQNCLRQVNLWTVLIYQCCAVHSCLNNVIVVDWRKRSQTDCDALTEQLRDR